MGMMRKVQDIKEVQLPLLSGCILQFKFCDQRAVDCQFNLLTFKIKTQYFNVATFFEILDQIQMNYSVKCKIYFY